MGCIYIYAYVYTYIYVYNIYIYIHMLVFDGFCLPITDLEIIGHFIYMCVCGNYLIFED